MDLGQTKIFSKKKEYPNTRLNSLTLTQNSTDLGVSKVRHVYSLLLLNDQTYVHILG